MRLPSPGKLGPWVMAAIILAAVVNVLLLITR